MSDDTKPSARAMAAAQALDDIGFLGDSYVEDYAAIIDQEMPGYDELLAVTKELTAVVRASHCACERCERILGRAAAAVALAEPEQKK